MSDHHRLECGVALRVLGAVDEPQQVSLVKRPEAVHLVDDLGAGKEAAGEPLSELEAQIEVMGADVRQQVARRGAASRTSGSHNSEPTPVTHVNSPSADRPSQARDVRQHVTEGVLGAR